jgi:hypothetical protein
VEWNADPLLVLAHPHVAPQLDLACPGDRTRAETIR